MWKIIWLFAQGNRFRQYKKKHPLEFEACVRNLDRLVGAFEHGMTLQQCTFGFFRSEGANVYRIGQSCMGSAHETRLYIYIRITGQEIYLLTIGDKNTQQRDILWCHSTVEEIQRAWQ